MLCQKIESDSLRIVWTQKTARQCMPHDWRRANSAAGLQGTSASAPGPQPDRGAERRSHRSQKCTQWYWIPNSSRKMFALNLGETMWWWQDIWIWSQCDSMGKNWKTFTDNRAWTESWWDRSRACYDILNPCHNYCLEQVQVPVQERQAKHRAVQEMQISPNGFGKLCGGWRMGQQGAAK